MSEQDVDKSLFEVDGLNPLLRGELKYCPMNIQTLILLNFAVDWSVNGALLFLLILPASLLRNAKLGESAI